MFLDTPYDDQTWDLIVSAMTGDLSPLEEVQFRQWLEASTGNQEFFDRLSRIWNELDVEEFSIVEQTDDAAAWEGFLNARQQYASQQKNTIPPSETTPVISMSDARIKKLFPGKTWMSAAAVILLLAGACWWIFAAKSHTYETALNERRTVALPDGTTVTLLPQTRIRLASGFNSGHRTVSLLGGTARFDVVHNAQKPFTVETDAASIQDIGTSFTVLTTTDSISVSVTQGMIAFTPKISAGQHSPGTSRQIAAGGSICLYTTGGHSGEVREDASAEQDSLHFRNAPLSEVLTALEKHSGRPIRLADSLRGQKRLTINLSGESLEDALRVVCASMHLQYKPQSGGYLVY